MILPEGFEQLHDDELRRELVDSGAYDADEAEAVIAILRHPVPGMRAAE